MWLSTDKGITRYDGFRFRDYPLIMNTDSLSISLHQTVKTFREGSDGLYYALLFEGGLIGFDPVSEKYLPLSFDNPSSWKRCRIFIGAAESYIWLLYRDCMKPQFPVGQGKKVILYIVC